MRFTYQRLLQRIFISQVGPKNRLHQFHHQDSQFLTTSPSCTAKINRYLSDESHSYSSPSPHFPANRLEKLRQDLKVALEDIVTDLIEASRKVDPDVAEHCGEILRYNMFRGKKNRGLAVIESYRQFDLLTPQPERNLKSAYVMGSCVEMLHVFLWMVDDLIDGAYRRRGQPCWHRIEGNETIANNDAVLLECGIYILLKKYFCNESYYSTVLDRFHEATTQVTMGQCLEELTTKNFHETRKLEQFTMSRYKNIVLHKTAHYSYYFPIALSMNMVGITDPELHKKTRDIMIDMGILHQVQDDYLNCFGDLNLLGKDGRDIEFGTCTWPIVVALERTNARQKAILEECYGKSDRDKVETVENIYKEIGLPEIYSVYEEEANNDLIARIEALPKCLPREAFYISLDTTYKRKF